MSLGAGALVPPIVTETTVVSVRDVQPDGTAKTQVGARLAARP